MNRPGRGEGPLRVSDVLCAAEGTCRVVDLIEHCGNSRQRIERLVSAWNQGSNARALCDGEQDDQLVAASAEPRRRARTPLTDEEVDAMRTARANGVSVTALSRQLGVHRGTVWAKTRNL